ncbi:MAG: metalloregulator ArsR/SmtB family transcription factor [Oscillospiraceae bacterium]
MAIVPDKNSVCDCDVIHTEIVDDTRSKLIEDTKIYELADFFKVFGDSTRVKILLALDKNEMCVCDLAFLLDMTKSAVSHQLKVLRTSKLVRCRRDGKNIFYSLADDHVSDILEKGLEHIDE